MVIEQSKLFDIEESRMAEKSKFLKMLGAKYTFLPRGLSLNIFLVSEVSNQIKQFTL